MKIVMIVGMAVVAITLMAGKSSAASMRVYCKPNGVVLERRADQNFTEENKIFPFATIMIEEEKIPSGNSDQLRCQGGKLVIDESVKTPAIVRQQKVQGLKEKLDALLADDEPDIVEVIRVQRQIEKTKSS